MHLAYAFAQKNKMKGVTTTDTKQPCVLLCAPSDTAVDSALCELCSVLSSQCDFRQTATKDTCILKLWQIGCWQSVLTVP